MQHNLKFGKYREFRYSSNFPHFSWESRIFSSFLTRNSKPRKWASVITTIHCGGSKRWGRKNQPMRSSIDMAQLDMDGKIYAADISVIYYSLSRGCSILCHMFAILNKWCRRMQFLQHFISFHLNVCFVQVTNLVIQ